MAENKDLTQRRAAGHHAAADHLEQVAKQRELTEVARRGPGTTAPPGIKALSDGVGTDTIGAQREAQELVESMERAGSGGPGWPVASCAAGVTDDPDVAAPAVV